MKRCFLLVLLDGYFQLENISVGRPKPADLFIRLRTTGHNIVVASGKETNLEIKLS